MSPRILLLTTPLSVLCACDIFSVDFDVDLKFSPEYPVEFELGDLSTECDDPVTHIDTEDGWTEYSTTLEGSLCHIHADGEMLFLDMAEVREAVRKEIEEEGQNPEKVTVQIDAVTVRFKNIALLDAAGTDLPIPTLDEWSAELSLYDAPFASFSGADTDTLLAAATEIALAADQVERLDRAYQESEMVSTSGTADLIMDWETAYQDVFAAADAPRLAFTFSVQIEASGTAHLLK